MYGSLIASCFVTVFYSTMLHNHSLLNDVSDSDLKVTPIAGTHPSIAIEGIRMASAYDPWREAQLALPRLVNHASVHLFGIGLGHLPHVLLNTSKQLEHLYIYILNLNIFKIQIEHMPFKEWLNDPRVHIQVAKPNDKPSNSGVTHTALPDLQLISPQLWRLRDRLHALLNENFINSAFRSEDPVLQNHLKANEPLLQQDPGVKALFSPSPATRHACVIGSGPSLEQSMARLQNLTDGTVQPWVIAVDTAFAALLHAGVKVDCVVSIEKRINTRWLPTQHSDNINLVYTPVVPKDVLLAWKGPRYASFTQTALHQTSVFFDASSCLFCGGSVIHTATDLALKMGFKEISFWGVDFGYPSGKTHSFWPSGELGGHPNRSGHWVMDVNGDKLASSPNFANYLSEMEDHLARHPNTQFFNASQSGAEILGTQPFSEYSV